MKLKLLLQKINPRIIAVHGIAMWMFMYAFDLFAKLYYLPITKAFKYNKTTSGALRELEKQGFTALSLNYDSIIFSLIPVLGLLIAFMVSVSVSLFRHWFWLNSALAFIIMFLLYRYDITERRFFQILFFAPGRLFSHNLLFYLISNSTILLLLGLCLFFLKPTSNFIAWGNFKKRNSDA